MIEMRWLTTREETPIIPPSSEIQYGKSFEKRTVVTKRKLQYRQKIDISVRAGMDWDANSLARTANWQWSEWKDVPEVADE